MTIRLALLAAMVAALPLAGVRAASREAMLTGNGLSIDTPCAVAVDIEPDPGLIGQMSISATADHPEELDRLVLESGTPAKIHTGLLGCWHPLGFGSFERTLHLTVRVPAGSAMTIDESGSGRYRLGDIDGPLKLDLSGSADVQAGRMAGLTVDVSGSGDVHVAALHDKVGITLSGHGAVLVDRADAPALVADLSGAGSVQINAGGIGQVKLDDSGMGSMRFGASVGEATVNLSGVGSVHFAKLAGALHKDVSGVGTVTIGE
jgi:hypothetical protein